MERRSIRERGDGRPVRRSTSCSANAWGIPVAAVSDPRVSTRWAPVDEAPIDAGVPRRGGGLRRLALRAAVPLSVVAVAAVLVVMFAVYLRQLAPSEPTAVPPSGERNRPAAPLPTPASAPAQSRYAEGHRPEGDDGRRCSARACLLPTATTSPPRDMRCATSSGTNPISGRGQPTSCSGGPSGMPTRAPISPALPSSPTVRNSTQRGTDQTQQTHQTSVTTLQSIEGDLQGINHDLQNISDGLHGGS